MSKFDALKVEEIGPCPFCGLGGPERVSLIKNIKGGRWSIYVVCKPCYVVGPKRGTAIAAVAAWNMRVGKNINDPQQPRDLVAEGMAMVEDLKIKNTDLRTKLGELQTKLILAQEAIGDNLGDVAEGKVSQALWTVKGGASSDRYLKVGYGNCRGLRSLMGIDLIVYREVNNPDVLFAITTMDWQRNVCKVEDMHK